MTKEFHWWDELSAKLLQLQIVVAALVAGCVIFLAITIVIGFQKNAADGAAKQVKLAEPAKAVESADDVAPAKTDMPMLTYIALLLALVAMLTAWIAPSMMLRRTRRAIVDGSWRLPQDARAAALLAPLIERCGDAGRLWLVYYSRTIVRAALLEGAIFFMLVVYMMEQSSVLLIGSLAMIFVLAAQFPGRSQTRHWMEDQLNTLRQQRQFADGSNMEDYDQ